MAKGERPRKRRSFNIATTVDGVQIAEDGQVIKAADGTPVPAPQEMDRGGPTYVREGEPQTTTRAEGEATTTPKIVPADNQKRSILAPRPGWWCAPCTLPPLTLCECYRINPQGPDAFNMMYAGSCTCCCPCLDCYPWCFFCCPCCGECPCVAEELESADSILDLVPLEKKDLYRRQNPSAAVFSNEAYIKATQSDMPIRQLRSSTKSMIVSKGGLICYLGGGEVGE